MKDLVKNNAQIVLDAVVRLVFSLAHNQISVQIEGMHGQIEYEKCGRHNNEHLGDLPRHRVGL